MLRNCLILFTFLSLLACKDSKNTSNNSQPDKSSEDEISVPIQKAIANRYGLQHWGDVHQLSFTFNVGRGDNHFERSYQWEPKSGMVTYIKGTDTLQFQHQAPKDSLEVQADRAFVNDKYWLMAPFQMVWDQGTTISVTNNNPAPISKDTLQKLTVTYDSIGGYTPGDAYDFYITKDHQIKEWVFRKGNQETPSLINTWKEEIEVEGIRFTTQFQDSTENFYLYFTNIKIE